MELPDAIHRQNEVYTHTHTHTHIYTSPPSSSRGLLESRYEVADGGVDSGSHSFVSLYLAISLSRLSLQQHILSL